MFLHGLVLGSTSLNGRAEGVDCCVQHLPSAEAQVGGGVERLTDVAAGLSCNMRQTHCYSTAYGKRLLASLGSH